MIIPSNIGFKIPELLQEYQEIRADLQIVLEDMASWVVSQGHEFLITDLLSEESEDLKLGRISKSHSEGRAADIRVFNWPSDFRKKFEEYFEKKYANKAAISSKTGKPNLIEIHDNSNGLHCHIQLRRV